MQACLSTTYISHQTSDQQDIHARCICLLDRVKTDADNFADIMRSRPRSLLAHRFLGHPCCLQLSCARDECSGASLGQSMYILILVLSQSNHSQAESSPALDQHLPIAFIHFLTLVQSSKHGQASTETHCTACSSLTIARPSDSRQRYCGGSDVL